MNGCVSFLGSCLSDTVSISNLSTNGSDLYNFMVQNNKLIELKKFEMIPSVDPEIENVSTRINELCDIYYIEGNIHPPPIFYIHHYCPLAAGKFMNGQILMSQIISLQTTVFGRIQEGAKLVVSLKG